MLKPANKPTNATPRHPAVSSHAAGAVVDAAHLIAVSVEIGKGDPVPLLQMAKPSRISDIVKSLTFAICALRLRLLAPVHSNLQAHS